MIQSHKTTNKLILLVLRYGALKVYKKSICILYACVYYSETILKDLVW